MHAQSQKHQALALFDFDGTLCEIDSFTGFIFFTLPKRHIFWRGLRILPWIMAYYVGVYPAHLMRPKLFKYMFKGQSQQHVNTAATDYAAQLVRQHLSAVVYEQLRQHQSLGHEIVLVSASIQLYLKPVCQQLGIQLICSEVDTTHPQLSGEYSSLDCSNAQKKVRILEQLNIDDYAQVYAYGNSVEDHAMLSLAHIPHLIKKDKKLPIVN